MLDLAKLDLDLRAKLREVWGYPDFRSVQLDIIHSVCSGRDTLGLMPTGGGKSLTFQVPALLAGGVCLIVTPLIALMDDQVNALRRRGILAHAIHSGIRQQECDAAYQNCYRGASKFLYVAPERLATEGFLRWLDQIRVSMLVVDEAHCISQWGYDFRPSYLTIAAVREHLPRVPVLALTATATPAVAADIMAQLHFAKPNVVSTSFARPNIAYIVRPTCDKRRQLLRIFEAVPGSALVYCLSRKGCRELAEFLTDNGYSADYFHAGLEAEVKQRKQREWTLGQTRIMVCTNAFGMGIDKPDVRVVVHVTPPSSLEAYFQEAGRAGRDGKKSYAVFLWDNAADAAALRRQVTLRYPSRDFCCELYTTLCNQHSVGVGSGAGYRVEFNSERWSFANTRNSRQVAAALELLKNAGLMRYEPDATLHSRIMARLERGAMRSLEHNHPELREVLWATLRLYEGLWSEWVEVDEEEIAYVAECDRQRVYSDLLALKRHGALDYNPAKHTSFLLWLCDRPEPNNIQIAAAIYEQRLEADRERAESIIEYCQTDSVCRGRQLLAYFGQRAEADCGICDVCVGRKRKA